MLRFVGLGEAPLRALVDAGFYGDTLTLPERVEGIGIDFKYSRRRRLPDGRAAEADYGVGVIELFGEVTGGDIEVCEWLRLPGGIDALLGVTALEKLGFRVNPRTGRREGVWVG